MLNSELTTNIITSPFTAIPYTSASLKTRIYNGFSSYPATKGNFGC